MASAASGRTDYDLDNDGLIEIEGPRTGVVLYIDDASVRRTARQCGPGQTPLVGTFIVTTDWGAGLSGTITVSPDASWSRGIPAGGSTNSLGFSANRPAGNTALPSGLVVGGTF